MKSPFYVPRMRRNTDRLRWSFRLAAVPVVLIVVASLHFCQWSLVNRSSWGAGCSFGMFATVDYHGSRFVKCFIKSNHEWVPVELDDSFKEPIFRVRVMPTEGNLKQLATHILAHKFIVVDEDETDRTLTPCLSDQADVAGQQFDSICIELWGMNLNASEHELQSHLINHIKVRKTDQPGDVYVAAN